MRLSAIYIPSGILTHIFGEDHKGQTINLGGKYIYTFEEDSKEQVFLKDKKENPKFIENFWLNNIKLVSAIVGENGTGKTTILNSLRGHYSSCKFIYEDTDTSEYTIYDDAEINDIIYYSPFLDIYISDSENWNFRDLSKYQMMIDDTEHENLDLTTLLELHNSENLKRWIKFIELKDLNNLLEKMSLPTFDKITIKINYIYIKPHDTSYQFRPFFEELKEKIDKERTNREQLIIDEIGIKEFQKRKAGKRIRLELEVINRIISKTQNILESSGNKYLEEGHINGRKTTDSKEFKESLNSKEAFYWFLANSYIQLPKKSKRISFPTTEIKNLIETILSYLPENEEIDNWTEFDVNFSQALEINNAYEKFLLAFRDNFAYDKKVLMSFSPSKNLSSGEKGLYDLFSVLNDFNYKVESKTHTKYSIFNKREKISNNLLILLDEADLGFHPEWKKRYINIIQQVIPFIFKGKNIQIIITTHDPLTLSDIPNNNIVYLHKTTDGKTELLEQISKQRPTKTFGANISDLLADSFFVNDGLIGDFAKEKIEDLINELNLFVESKSNNQVIDVSKEEQDRIYKTINIVDEPIIKNKLIEMYNFVFDIAINNEIKELEERIKYLKKLKDNQND